jgi:hypothetical protein
MAATHYFRKGIHFEHKSVFMLVNEYLDNFSCALRRSTMLEKRKKPSLMMKVFVVFVFLAFATAGFAARIVPTGMVSIIEDSKVIGKFSQEAPLPEGVLLRCEGNCAVKLDDVYMTVKPKTVFSVNPMADRHGVLVQQGTVYYSLNESSRPLAFDTTAENMTTGDLYMTDDELRGYVRVVGNDTEIGVLSGGSMMLKIGSDEMAVLSGNKITITLATLRRKVSAQTQNIPSVLSRLVNIPIMVVLVVEILVAEILVLEIPVLEILVVEIPVAEILVVVRAVAEKAATMTATMTVAVEKVAVRAVEKAAVRGRI